MLEKKEQKEPLLFLCHRIPFPPNKGDKIRSFNILKALTKQYDVYLGCFIDDHYDERYVDELKNYCHELFTVNQHKLVCKIKGLKAFLTNKPITIPYYFDSKMQSWVAEKTQAHGIKKVFVYSSSMAQYVEGEKYQHMHKVIDFVDVDSDKWRQYADKKSGIAKWVFNREYRLLAKYEDKICQAFDASLFVSPDEAKLFSDRQPMSSRHKVQGILNGVDVKFFDPQADMSVEAKLPKTPFISFTGAMDYWANVDAVVWFADQVWPLVIQKHPDAIFAIVGGNPSAEVSALAHRKGIIVTGRVHDVRPFVHHAKAVVAPLRIARGIQNKVLEAMSLNKVVICTSMAMEGINAPASDDVYITDDAQQFATICSQCLSLADNDMMVRKNRDWIQSNFTWQQTLLPLADTLVEKTSD